VYVKGDENLAADALSRTVFVEDSCTAQERAHSLLGPSDDDDDYAVCFVRSAAPDLYSCVVSIASEQECPVNTFSAAAVTKPHLRKLAAGIDESFLNTIRSGYASDPWCQRLARVAAGLPSVKEIDGLWFIGEHLVIPQIPQVRTRIFGLAHDALGHFGLRKSYEALRESFYWPRMRTHLENLYLKSCDECQHFKDRTTRVPGPLHPLPVPNALAESIAMDFIGPLPEDQGYDSILSITDRLGSDIRLIPCRTDATMEDVAQLFFTHWYCENGLPTSIVSDRDRLFISAFWKALHQLSGVKLAMSSSFHPETDGASERTNKSVIQSIRFHIERNQKGWVASLPRVHFALMNTINASTGFSPFQLRLGRSPRIVPPVIVPPSSAAELKAAELIQQHELLIMEAQDNLLLAKINQAGQANKHRGEEIIYCVGDKVMLSTRNHRKELKAGDLTRATKFLARWIGPFSVTRAHPDTSTYTLDMPNSPKAFPVFHASQLKPYYANDDVEFPTRSHICPPPLRFEDGAEEFFIEKILDEHKT
jgi:hypothetical protein